MIRKHPIKILIADDLQNRVNIRRLLGTESGFLISGEASDAEELIIKFEKLNPDIILLDIGISVLSGSEIINVLASKGMNLRVLFTSNYDSEEIKYYCFLAGGTGLINRTASAEELFRALKTVHAGYFYFGDDWDENKIKELTYKYEGKKIMITLPVSSELTLTERHILFFVGKGLTSVQIAGKLFLGKRTIDSYRSRILKKLKLKTAAEMIKYALEHETDLSVS